MKRRIVTLLLVALILGSIFTVAFAAEYPIMPCYNHTGATSTTFSISSSGNATLAASYSAYPSTFTGATITCYIEKKTLGLFWTRVDVDQPDNQWVYTSTDYSDAFGVEFQLTSTGTYRGTITYEISGSNAADDVIEYVQERTY